MINKKTISIIGVWILVISGCTQNTKHQYFVNWEIDYPDGDIIEDYTESELGFHGDRIEYLYFEMHASEFTTLLDDLEKKPSFNKHDSGPVPDYVYDGLENDSGKLEHIINIINDCRVDIFSQKNEMDEVMIVFNHDELRILYLFIIR